MFKHLSLLSLLLALIVPSNALAAKAGHVRHVEPTAEKSKGSCADDATWKVVTLGSVDPKTCFKTSDGGGVELQLNGDNSSIKIAENSVVFLDSLVEKNADGFYVTKPHIQKGYIGFNVEKNKHNKVDFSTGTAAASIRGTKGFIGGDSLSFMASLESGKLAIFPTGQDSLAISQGETVIGREKFIILKLKSSGDMEFAKKLIDLLADTTKSIDELAAAAIAADQAFQEKLAEKKAAEQETQVAVDTTQKAEEVSSLKAPRISYTGYDSLRCVANVSITDVPKDTETIVQTLMDGTPISEVNVKNSSSKRLKLQSGVHEYEFVVENSAGRSSVQQTLGCYPLKPFSIKVFGLPHEHLQIPPPPPGVEDVIMETLQFQIRIPENDPNFLNRVLVRQDGTVILKETLSQIQNLDYQIPVELKRGHMNRFVIEAIHKSGYVVKTTKVYEVEK